MDTTLMDTHTNTTPINVILMDTTPTDTIDNINNTCINAKNKENKFDIAEKYIIEAFTGHCSEEGKKNICAVMKDYSNGETDFSNYSSISVKNLKPLDLYHFGWNIWNHFRVGEQDVIAKLLKIIFAEKFPRTSIKTIKSHLKDDEKKGRIIIKEDLSKLNE
jgi:putative mobilizable transposon, tnpC protein